MARRIGFLLVDMMLATSATLPSEMLLAAASAARGLRQQSPGLTLDTIGIRTGLINTGAGLPLTASFDLATAPQPDILFVPALWRNPQRILQKSPEVIPWLQAIQQRGATIAGVGTGCCFLAAAGLLDNKPATTHWHYFDAFEKHYPTVQLKRDYFITQADEIYCAASVNSLADLTVHFIHRLFGKAVAHHIERHFSHEIRRAYESMRYYAGSNDKHADEIILQAQLYLQDHYALPVACSDVAAEFDMSVRTFNRRFKAAVGKSPVKYLQEIRLTTARELLQTSNLTIGEIGFKVGYQDVGYFSTLFKQLFNATPNDYRTTVRAKLFSVGPSLV